MPGFRARNMGDEAVFVTQGPMIRDAYFSAFADMRGNGTLCDVVIHAENEVFQAHRVVLAAGIPYFKTMFESNMMESKKREIFMKDVNASALGNIIDCVYTNKLKIMMSDVMSLFAASIYFQFDFGTNSCLEFLLQRVDISNILAIRTYAEAAVNSDVIEKTNLYICNNFEEFSLCEEFLELPFDVLKHVISRNDLRVVSEKTVFKAVISWVKAREVNRRAFLLELLQCVRMKLLSLEYLKAEVSTVELIRRSPACLAIVQEAVQFHTVNEEHRSMPQQKFGCPHLGEVIRQSIEMMYVISGSEDVTDIYTYDSFQKQWNSLIHLPGAVSISDIACTEEKMYFLNGKYCGVLNLRTLNLSKLKYSDKFPKGAGVVFYDQKLYFFGRSDTVTSRNVYTFCLNDGTCVQVGEILERRKCPKAICLGNHIFVIGGYYLGEALRSCEVYNPETRTSNAISPMLDMRSGYDCAAVRGKIYVYGLCETERANYGTCTGEVYNPLTGQWTVVKQMDGPRRQVRLMSHKGELFATSYVHISNKPHENHCEISVYDPNENEWKRTTQLPSFLESATPNVLMVTNSSVQFKELESDFYDDDYEDYSEGYYPWDLLDNFRDYESDNN